jgi:hypothetical protein
MSIIIQGGPLAGVPQSVASFLLMMMYISETRTDEQTRYVLFVEHLLLDKRCDHAT